MPYATGPSWMCAFSGDGYGASCGTTAMINKLLWNKIPATDIRKGWWLDENQHSDNWANLTWGSAKGDAIAKYVIDDVKVETPPYTNIKFGMKSGIGSTLNNSDWPLMRVEEMILIMAEAKAHSNEAEARKILEDFVKQYRDPSYNSNERGLKLLDEIWFQRRVELWGEGFGMKDVRRLQKPVVRFHSGQESNVPDAFRFNVAADDGWMLLRFPQREMNTNFAIVDNTGGNQPVAGQNPELILIFFLKIFGTK